MLARSCRLAWFALVALVALIGSFGARAQADLLTISHEEGTVRWRLRAAPPRPTCDGQRIELALEPDGVLALCVRADDAVHVEHARYVQGTMIAHIFEGSAVLDARVVRVERGRRGEVRALHFDRASITLPHRYTRPASFTGLYEQRVLELRGALRMRA